MVGCTIRTLVPGLIFRFCLRFSVAAVGLRWYIARTVETLSIRLGGEPEQCAA